MAYQQVPGFTYLFQTDRPDAVVVLLPTEGFLGAIGRKREMIVTKGNLAKCLSELTLGVPVWFLQSGIAHKIENELEQWAYYGRPTDLSLHG
jgi:hypothetical protein